MVSDPVSNLGLGMPSVQTVPPPADRIGPITQAVRRNAGLIPQGRRGVLVMVGNETHANIAVVTRMGDHVTIEGYIGKAWKGSLNYGVQGVIEF